jgi:predicted lipoprotein with Yx(FWY)xxD motif
MQIKDMFIRAVPFLLVGSLFSCSKSSTNSGGGTPPPPTIDITLTADAKFGSILVNAKGETLYFFSPDANGNSACTGDCLVTWPSVNYDNLTVGTGLKAADFATITRSDGAKQTTYKGWPLYTYAGDSGPISGGAYGTPTPGTVKGDGINGVWFVAKPDYTVMLAKAQLIGNDGKSYKSDFTEGTGATLYMTDDWGKTFYAYSPDKSGTNTWTKSDFSNDSFWPIVQLTAVQNVPSALNKADFGSITVFTKPQLTYKGWPVYYFGGDAVRGDTKGVSVPTPGIWPIMNQSSPLAPNP